ncbi:MAG: metallophosphoesterase, partial [Mobilitalea sp.]
MIRGKRKIKFIAITALVTAFTLMGASLYRNDIGTKAEAATKAAETVDLRIIGTTDIHGQLNSTNYEQSVDYSYGGLARVYDLILGARSEVANDNSITVDAGDVLYDYTTEYIFSESQTEIQPIYKAMAMMGYDAITLGNHDFDYGYEYIQRQLNGAGLRDITVVSNVTDSKTGEYPFLENMIITRTMETSGGKKVEVKIGIIGQTVPVLTSKTQSYIGILKTEDMVINAQAQAKKLKENGADIVVALSHTGIGPENPELNFKNVAYALTKIPEIDVVVCGHEHNLFPTTDPNSAYLKLPNVDPETFLMNDKNVIMAGNRGSAIGIVDLTLEVTETGFEIVNRKSTIRKVTASNTKENEEIADGFAKWENQLLEYSTEVIAKIEEGTVIQNFYG